MFISVRLLIYPAVSLINHNSNRYFGNRQSVISYGQRQYNTHHLAHLNHNTAISIFGWRIVILRLTGLKYRVYTGTSPLSLVQGVETRDQIETPMISEKSTPRIGASGSDPKAKIVWLRPLCDGCGACVVACPQGAISVDRKSVV